MSKDQRGGGRENMGHNPALERDTMQDRGQATGAQRGKPQNWDRGQGQQGTQGGHGGEGGSGGAGRSPEDGMSQRQSPNRSGTS